MEQQIAIAFGRGLRLMRLEAELTQEQLGLRANLQRKHVSALELGQKLPNIATVFALASALEINPAQLIERTQQELQLLSKLN